MKKCLLLLIIWALLVSPASGLEFVDAMGRSVQLNVPERVVSLYNSYGDAWMLSGGKLVGSIADDEGMDSGVQNLGSHISPNMELLFSLDADFVLLSADVASHRKIAPLLEDAGIACAFFSTRDWRAYMEMMGLFTQINGRPDLMEDQEELVQRPIEKMIAKAERLGRKPSALLIRAHSTAVKARNSESTVAGAILRDMGFVNLADANSLLCEGISMEAVLMEDPDYIFVVLQGDGDAAEKSLAMLTENPAWATLTAVREGRIYMLDRELFHYHPNARWAEAYAFVLDILEEK